MQQADFLRLIENVVECGPGKVSADMALTDVPGWDSLAVVGLIAALDRQLGVRVQASALAQCKSVQDLIALAGDKVSA